MAGKARALRNPLDDRAEAIDMFKVRKQTSVGCVHGQMVRPGSACDARV